MAMKIMGGRREPTEMDMVMESITRVENEIQQKIFQLGQTYYEEHKDGEISNDKYFAMIDSVRKLEENRKGFYKNKLRLEGQMMCENCGSIISYGSVFCNVCGKKADERSEGAARPLGAELKCRACGTALEAGAQFCASCGTRVG